MKGALNSRILESRTSCNKHAVCFCVNNSHAALSSLVSGNPVSAVQTSFLSDDALRHVLLSFRVPSEWTGKIAAIREQCSSVPKHEVYIHPPTFQLFWQSDGDYAEACIPLSVGNICSRSSVHVRHSRSA